VVLRKVEKYSADMRSRFLAYKEDVLSGKDDGFGILMAKLERELASDAHINTKVVKNASQCCLKRKQKREKRIKLREMGQIGPHMKPALTSSSDSACSNILQQQVNDRLDIDA